MDALRRLGAERLRFGGIVAAEGQRAELVVVPLLAQQRLADDLLIAAVVLDQLRRAVSAYVDAEQNGTVRGLLFLALDAIAVEGDTQLLLHVLSKRGRLRLARSLANFLLLFLLACYLQDMTYFLGLLNCLVLFHL